jgi:hypothetical protein
MVHLGKSDVSDGPLSEASDGNRDGEEQKLSKTGKSALKGKDVPCRSIRSGAVWLPLGIV